MSSTAQNVLPVNQVDVDVVAGRISTPRSRWLVYPLCTVLALVVNYLIGKDMPWDTLNYHLYAGLSALHSRFNQDYFAAGPQSYFNPYAYVPFYLLVKAGLPALVISSVLVILQSVALWLTYELAVTCSDSARGNIPVIAGVMAMALAFVNPIFLQELGSSFSDITTGTIALGGWLLLARAFRAPGATRVALAAVLLGIATALKPTNAVHAVSATVVLLMLPMSLKERLKQLVVYVFSGAAGFLLAGGVWAYHLWRVFGNPVFPLLNGLFRSPEFITDPVMTYRFIPQSIWDALRRPFELMLMGRLVDTELSEPDLRYAALIFLGAMALTGWLWRRMSPKERPLRRAGDQVRLQAALGCAFAIDWSLWLTASGNGRYFLPMGCVAAVLIVALLFRVFASRHRPLVYIFLGLMAAQLLQLDQATELRWTPVPWGGPWLNVQMPAELRSKPNLYLTMGVESNSFIAAYLPKDSGLINFSGGYPLGPDGTNGARVEELIRRFMPNVRVLIDGERLYDPREEVEPTAHYLDTALERFGLKVDANNCATIALKGLPPPLPIVVKRKGVAQIPRLRSNVRYLLTCRVIADTSDRTVLQQQHHFADRVFDNLERACPRLFQPRGLYTEHIGYAWQRLYLNTDVTAWISHGAVKFESPLHGGRMVDLGRATDWEKGPLPVACGYHGGQPFARVLPKAAEGSAP